MSTKWTRCPDITQVAAILLEKIEIRHDPRLIKCAAPVTFNENLTQPYPQRNLASREKRIRHSSVSRGKLSMLGLRDIVQT